MLAEEGLNKAISKGIAAEESSKLKED